MYQRPYKCGPEETLTHGQETFGFLSYSTKRRRNIRQSEHEQFVIPVSTLIQNLQERDTFYRIPSALNLIGWKYRQPSIGAKVKMLKFYVVRSRCDDIDI
ncbi:hypothetical protein HZS_5385 [Henneguya salminicola]|nr:hypothetical protein HZS_5385 [Henneguya salminicola]